jgi:hypothetical protein
MYCGSKSVASLPKSTRSPPSAATARSMRVLSGVLIAKSNHRLGCACAAAIAARQASPPAWATMIGVSLDRSKSVDGRTPKNVPASMISISHSKNV